VNLSGGQPILPQPPHNIMMSQQPMQNTNFIQKPQQIFQRPIVVQSRKMGQIDVIGSTDLTSRRHIDNMHDMNPISVLGPNSV
jgi:hypothetical protein